MKKKICGIVEIDFPTLSDSDHRKIQLGEKTTFPGGMSVAEYASEVELLKEKNLKAEADKRTADLKAEAKRREADEESAAKQPKPIKQENVSDTDEPVVEDEAEEVNAIDEAFVDPIVDKP